MIQILLHLSFALEYAELFGDVDKTYYYYIDLHVGTPPTRQSVIVDTGSHLTGFPCQSCTNCGQHMDSYFNVSASYTARVLDCQDPQCSGCRQDSCHYSQSYAEGSSISGYLVRDKVGLGDDLGNPQVDFVFGCHTRETNLFRTQYADGIMGLKHRSNGQNIIDALFKHKDISTDQFALCFKKHGGVMTVGGYNQTLHNSESFYTTYVDSGFYSIKLTATTVGGKDLGLNDFGTGYSTGTILDSGTTYSFLKWDLYRDLSAEIESFCDKSENNCKGEKNNVSTEPHPCYRYTGVISLEDFFNTFPLVQIFVENQPVDWEPKDYFYEISENNYCYAFFNNGGSSSVLGASFMKGKDVLFDIENKLIGFAKSDCDYYSGKKPTRQQEIIDPVKNLRKERKSQKSSSAPFIIIGGALLLFALLSLAAIYIVRKYSSNYQTITQGDDENFQASEVRAQ